MLQIAKEIGVTKQAVFYRIKKPPLSDTIKPFISKENGVLMFDIKGETLIKQAFNVEIVKTFNDKETLKLNTSFDSEIIKLLQDNILVLQEQLKTKDNQIEKISDELAKEREHSRDISDKLFELTRNSQILLKQEQDKTVVLLPEQLDINSSDGTKNKKGFFQRLFKNKNRNQ